MSNRTFHESNAVRKLSKPVVIEFYAMEELVDTNTLTNYVTIKDSVANDISSTLGRSSSLFSDESTEITRITSFAFFRHRSANSALLNILSPAKTAADCFNAHCNEQYSSCLISFWHFVFVAIAEWK